MILVIGGLASGKRTYLLSLGYTDEQMGTTPLSDTPVVLGLENMLHDNDLSEDEMAALMRKDAVCCCEVGMGVVPLDARDRAWRERVGRACCILAEHADKVVRMVCGIPTRIK